jgi:hypothetical protein
MAAASFHETMTSTTQMRWCHSREANNLGYFMCKKERGEYMEHNNLRHFMDNKERDMYLEYDIQDI